MDLRAPRAGLQSQPPMSGWVISGSENPMPDRLRLLCGSTCACGVVHGPSSAFAQPPFKAIVLLQIPAAPADLKIAGQPCLGGWERGSSQAIAGDLSQISHSRQKRQRMQTPHPTPSFPSKPAAQGFFSINREGRVPEAGASALQFTKEILLTASGRSPRGPSRSALASSSS